MGGSRLLAAKISSADSGMLGFFYVVAGKPDHKLYAEFKAVFFQKGNCSIDILF